MLKLMLTYGVELVSVAASTTTQKGRAEAMTRQSAAPQAGPDEEDPSAAGGHNGQLNRSMILQTALRIVDRDGVDGLSMRRLSEAVGRDPVMLYRHVPNKGAVLDGVAELVLAQLSVDSTDPDWAGQLRTVARDFRQLALTHPNVVPLLVTRPLATPGRMPCTSTECCSATCTATSSMSCRRLSSDPRKPTTCSGSVFTGSRSPNSLNCVPWRPP
jgi:AcrR family transcriptional regulator